MSSNEGKSFMRMFCAVLVLLLSSFLPAIAQDSSREVTAALQQGVTAWNKGDLKGFMDGYLHSNDMTFTAAGRLIRGYDALQQRYEQTYGNSTTSMGQLEFTDIQVWPLGPDHALAVGTWALRMGSKVAYHPVSPKDNVGGVFSLVLVKTKDGWKILHDHTSRTETKR
jgi:uncharacterized protein (TIGR02246 family)